MFIRRYYHNDSDSSDSSECNKVPQEGGVLSRLDFTSKLTSRAISKKQTGQSVFRLERTANSFFFGLTPILLEDIEYRVNNDKQGFAIHEMFLDKWVKLFLDLDHGQCLDGMSKSDYLKNVVVGMIVPSILEFLNQGFYSHHTIGLDDVIIFEACRGSKRSCHIIFHTAFFASYAELYDCVSFWKWTMKNRGDGKISPYLDLIDPKSTFTQLRVPYSPKLDNLDAKLRYYDIKCDESVVDFDMKLFKRGMITYQEKKSYWACSFKKTIHVGTSLSTLKATESPPSTPTTSDSSKKRELFEGVEEAVKKFRSNDGKVIAESVTSNSPDMIELKDGTIMKNGGHHTSQLSTINWTISRSCSPYDCVITVDDKTQKIEYDYFIGYIRRYIDLFYKSKTYRLNVEDIELFGMHIIDDGKVVQTRVAGCPCVSSVYYLDKPHGTEIRGRMNGLMFTFNFQSGKMWSDCFVCKTRPLNRDVLMSIKAKDPYFVQSKEDGIQHGPKLSFTTWSSDFLSHVKK